MDGSTVEVSYAPAWDSGVPDRSIVSQTSSAESPPAQEGKDTNDNEPSFHAILSALNPLQYLPVVGTIYRAVTGDTIPEGLRIAGSVVVSALTAGPIGVAVNLASTFAEKAMDFDPEKAARGIAEDLGLCDRQDPPAGAPIEDAGTPLPTLSHSQLTGLASYASVAVA